MISVKQCPYTGLYSSDATRLPHKGPTVEALKRTLARLDFMEWKEDFTQVWPANGALDKAFREWERSRGLPGDGVYGQQEWKFFRSAKITKGPKKGQFALDLYSRKLIRNEWTEENVPDETDFRAAITDFCLRAERNEDNWHYLMLRPLDESVEPNQSSILSDCSFYVKQAYWWARQKSGLLVPDPSKQGWGSGVGNTEWYENDHPRVTTGVYKVADLAHYPGHVTICRRPGTATTSVWSSHGKEAGPIPASLYYRSDFQYVVRPPLS